MRYPLQILSVFLTLAPSPSSTFLSGLPEVRFDFPMSRWPGSPSYGQARVLYTSLGHPRAFDPPAFRRLLVNGIFWALSLEVPEPEEPSR